MMSTSIKKCDNVRGSASCESRITPNEWSTNNDVQLDNLLYIIKTKFCNQKHFKIHKMVQRVKNNDIRYCNVSTLTSTLLKQRKWKRGKRKKNCKKTPGLSKNETRSREKARTNKRGDRTDQFTNVGTERDNLIKKDFEKFYIRCKNGCSNGCCDCGPTLTLCISLVEHSDSYWDRFEPGFDLSVIE
jgi:hypothetical protein